MAAVSTPETLAHARARLAALDLQVRGLHGALASRRLPRRDRAGAHRALELAAAERRAVRRVIADHMWRLTVAVVDAAGELVDQGGAPDTYRRLAEAVTAFRDGR